MKYQINHGDQRFLVSGRTKDEITHKAQMEVARRCWWWVDCWMEEVPEYQTEVTPPYRWIRNV